MWKRMRRIVPIPEHLTHMNPQIRDAPDEVWANEDYEAFVQYERGGTRDGSVWLSIKRMDREPISDWRHKQQIKNEVIGPEREAVELYPRESRVVDNANQYHLYVAPVGVDWPVGFEHGMVLIRPDEVAAFNDADHPGRQRPMEPGLTIGRALDGARLPVQNVMVRRMLGIPERGA